MKTATLLEVMAEVGKLVKEVDDARDSPRVSADGRATIARLNISSAIDSPSAAERRDRLLRGAAWAILALHAHDSVAAKASTD